MGHDTPYNRDDANSRIAEIEAKLHTVAGLIGSNEDFEIIRPFVEPVLSAAVESFDRDEFDLRVDAIVKVAARPYAKHVALAALDDLAAGKWDPLRFSERALEEYESYWEQHDCCQGRPYCYLCSQIREDGAS